MELKQHEQNFSRLFIYPMLRLPRSFDAFIYNTYIYHEEFEGLVDPHIYVIMKFNPGYAVGFNFEDLEKIIQEHPDYVTQYDVKKGYYICMVFKVPEVHIDDYLMFVEGKYSKFAKDYKEYLSGNDSNTYYYMVFNRDIRLRQRVEELIGEKLNPMDEVVSKPDLEEETFRINKLK